MGLEPRWTSNTGVDPSASRNYTTGCHWQFQHCLPTAGDLDQNQLRIRISCVRRLSGAIKQFVRPTGLTYELYSGLPLPYPGAFPGDAVALRVDRGFLPQAMAT